MWHTCIRRLKEELASAIDKQFWFSSNIMLLETIVHASEKKALLSIKYCMSCYVVLSNHVVCNYCIQYIFHVTTQLSVKVCLYLVALDYYYTNQRSSIHFLQSSIITSVFNFYS